MAYRTPTFILQAELSLGRVSFVTVIQTPVVHNTSGEKEEQGQIQKLCEPSFQLGFHCRVSTERKHSGQSKKEGQAQVGCSCLQMT